MTDLTNNDHRKRLKFLTKKPARVEVFGLILLISLPI